MEHGPSDGTSIGSPELQTVTDWNYQTVRKQQGVKNQIAAIEPLKADHFSLSPVPIFRPSLPPIKVIGFYRDPLTFR